jgi:outer membrane protein
MLNSRRGALIAAVSSAGLIMALAAGPACAETLADAIALAYDSNPTLQAQRATQRALDENWMQARSGFRPTVSASAQANYQETRIPSAAIGLVDTNGDGVPDTAASASRIVRESGQIGLSISQPIYTGGRVASAVSAAEADILQGRENLRRVEAQVLGAVVQSYLDVRRDQEALRIRTEDVGVLQ